MDKSSDTALMNQLLSVVGKGNARGAERLALQGQLQFIKDSYETRWPLLKSAKAAGRKPLLRKFLANTAERRELRQQLGLDGKREVARASWLRMNINPLVEALINGREMPEELTPPVDPRLVELLEEYEDQNIKYLLDETGDSYRKTPMRSLVVEPFLLFLEINGLWDSAQPMTHVVAALFDWLGVEQKHRPTDTGIRTIVREFKRDHLPTLRRAFGNIKR
jgi:hypothetical protein